MTDYTRAELKSMIMQGAVLVQGEESYRINYCTDDQFAVTDEDTGEDYTLDYSDVEATDLIYGFKLLNTSASAIDWELLRKQKEWLVSNGSDEALGIVHLLDKLQDDAVDCGLSEKRVFGDI